MVPLLAKPPAAGATPPGGRLRWWEGAPGGVHFALKARAYDRWKAQTSRCVERQVHPGEGDGNRRTSADFLLRLARMPIGGDSMAAPICIPMSHVRYVNSPAADSSIQSSSRA